ncbi:glycosyltransferase family 4 protein [Flagellimonas myxillae]|uniref:glycosyltransferase family 4 protein n=1 Tax=Flagellimonas myxillae TaxID=2942214 RepID=UPI00201F4AAC|nr:glycosyltransferase family 4 protein [Muricauda myxillae]MCL6266097.1 glycosyltransferase family 4 protein [Muricauda myxillae]
MRKVLVIAYYWPPAGGPGVQRWLKFVKYFGDFGVEPVVYIPENPHYPLRDENLVGEVPKGVQILRYPIKEPYAWASLLSKKKTKTISSGIIKEKKPSLVEKTLLWVRGNWFIPDARVLWVKPSIEFLSSFVQKEGIETVITTGPPHSLHLIGQGLKKEIDLQWIADFRDPWTTIGYHKKLRLSKRSQQKHMALEKQVLNTADKIVVTSKATRLEFEALTDRPIKVITNGFDESLSPKELDNKFTISHLGSLLTGRNPVVLWQVLQELVAENPKFAKQLRIQLAGVVGEEVWESLSQFGLETFTTKLGYLPHDQVVDVQQKSQVLLMLEIDAEETKGIIPGKLFEYLNAGRPILALGPRDWEAGNIVLEMKSGAFVVHKNAAELKDVLLDWFGKYQQGALTSNAEGLEKYHRKELTKELVNFI